MPIRKRPNGNGMKKAPLRGTAVVTDTSAILHNPGVIEESMSNGYTLFLPLAVIMELNGLKNDANIGYDAREAIRKIEEYQISGNPALIIHDNPNFKNIGDLSRNIADHKIIATAINLACKSTRFEFERVRLLSRDSGLRILARKFGLGLPLSIEDYSPEQADVPTNRLIRLEVNPSDICIKSRSFPFAPYSQLGIEENEGVIYADEGFDAVAIRKGNRFEIIDGDINAVGIAPYSIIPEEENWAQHIALSQLLDNRIKLVFLEGASGSGKTILAVASALAQKNRFKQIVIIRPMIHVEKDHIGFLPGNLKDKVDPWMLPIMQALEAIKEKNKNIKTLELFQENKLIFQPLDYIRGQSIPRRLVIIDEGQNLTAHQFKAALTRAGEGTKIIVTGDLGQIEPQRRLDKRTSGLTISMANMRNHPAVAVTMLEYTVRSELAKLAEERL